MPRSSGMSRSRFVLTSWIGTFEPTANLAGAVTDPSSLPADADFRIVAEHEPVGGRLHRHPVDPRVAADQAVSDAVVEVADHAALEHDAVLDLGVADLGALPDRRERSHVRVNDFRARADDDRAPNHRSLDEGARLDDDFPFDARLGVDQALDAALEGVENQAVRLEHVFELAGVLPPALHEVRPHL